MRNSQINQLGREFIAVSKIVGNPKETKIHICVGKSTDIRSAIPLCNSIVPLLITPELSKFYKIYDRSSNEEINCQECLEKYKLAVEIINENPYSHITGVQSDFKREINLRLNGVRPVFPKNESNHNVSKSLKKNINDEVKTKTNNEKNVKNKDLLFFILIVIPLVLFIFFELLIIGLCLGILLVIHFLLRSSKKTRQH
ncbi:MAG: hypothetical protein KDC84_12445 [Crocinitomicaceae bacterium]|nr:hypothetical protein [Crocinitomicaceae bacterium]